MIEWIKFLFSRARKSSRFLSEDAIVADILRRMDNTSRNSWLGLNESDLIMAHHTTGRAIRNTYLLWENDNPYVVLDDAQHDDFPDQMSQRIIERVWKETNDGRSC